jgi:hypothetical protein
MQNKIQIFEKQPVRAVWNEENEKWWFSVVDVVGILTDSPNPRKYWSVLKTRLKQEGNETATNCSQLKLLMSDGKMRLTDIADTERHCGLDPQSPENEGMLKQVRHDGYGEGMLKMLNLFQYQHDAYDRYYFVDYNKTKAA